MNDFEHTSQDVKLTVEEDALAFLPTVELDR